MDIVARILGIYLILLLTFWFANKEKFWMLFYWGIGIVAIVIFLFILSKKQDKKRKDNLIKDIEGSSLERNIKEESLLRGGINNDQKYFNSLSGKEFELLLVRLFESMGYIVEHCGKIGDQGGDLIINKGQERILIQAKRYSGSIGNKAVQEAVAAKNYYDCNRSVLIGSSDFTSEAIELAKFNNVRLIGKKRITRINSKIS
ncbi:MAG: Restriction endonuclease [Parcubacteria bacterium 33_209]|nr:MAG: Restriction endonuclease [Parcubacteria bacterium 33_209]